MLSIKNIQWAKLLPPKSLQLRSNLLSLNSLVHSCKNKLPSFKFSDNLPQRRFMGVVTDDGQFKTWKPITPGLRGKKIASRKHLHKGKPIRNLTVAKRKKGGRNFTGRITVRHRGGGVKQRIRLVDFYRHVKGPQEVVRIEYDPGRTAHIALIKHTETNELSYILAPQNLKPGMIVESYMYKVREEHDKSASKKLAQDLEKIEDSENKESLDNSEYSADSSQDPDFIAKLVEKSNLTRSIRIEIGNCVPLRYIPPGTTIHNIGLHDSGRGQLARSAGSSAQLLYTSDRGTAQIKLVSGEVRKVPVNCCATIGSVSNPDHKHENLGKAGVNRLKGWRPTVRGTAMNKHDHPHGGGRGKSKGNRQPTSPWGKLAKGGKTRTKLNPMVIRHRKKK
ncbi:54S ribosomal protein rml2, mitochondrial [Smittium mucronatum]|uniref:Large ribosomal subunit protein uL2m n=1 Tax=Smittium mucronatum TaxID=133383 RepID=A0A1R0H4U9_9FUNG|nr:54S ribosomal protein rml2, mitochondrial [Smittium mucronatum]